MYYEYSWVPISIYFAPRQDILRIVHEWPQHDLEPYKVKCTPYTSMCYQCPQFPKFHSVFLYVHRFREKCTEWAQNDLKQNKIKFTHRVLLLSPSLKVQSFSFHGQSLLRYRQFWEKCTERPPVDVMRMQWVYTVYIFAPSRHFVCTMITDPSKSW